MDRLTKLLKRGVVLLDGATGTNLLNKNILPGESPSSLNLKNPEAVYELQKAYIEAGSDIILTNTFSANPFNFKGNKYKEVIRAGVEIACRASKGRLVFGDVGPLGILIKPYGDGNFDDVFKIYFEIFETFYKSGVKNFFIETFNSIIEAKAAFLAARNYADNIMVSFSFQENEKTIFGEEPESIAITFEKLGAKAVGVNCTPPETTLAVLERMSRITQLPLIAKPNAGRVIIENNKIRQSISDKELAGYFGKFIKSGAQLIGGCCGTTPEYIKRISVRRTELRIPSRNANSRFILASPQKFIEIDSDSTIIVGERLNPSGRKKIREKLLKNDYTIYGEEARLQEEAGAEALDVNAYVAGLEERKTLVNCLTEVIKNSKLPVFIDTQDYLAAKKAMEIYPGIGVYNSIPARLKDLEKFLPLVRYYGFKAVISLVGKRIPRNCKERLKNADFVLKIARRLRFPVADLIFDPLVFSIATGPEQIEETSKAVAELHRKGLKTILGISNISFGLPERSLMNAGMVNRAISAGVNFLILNPLDPRVMESYYTARALFKNEIVEYIQWVKNTKFVYPQTSQKFATKQRPKTGIQSNPAEDFMRAIVAGDTKSATEYIKILLDAGISPKTIIDNYISKAMKMVGDKYEKGVFFIPDLLKSAEATRIVLETIKKNIKRETGGREGRKKIVLATVKGDIHDIGKNIVAMVLESAGYEVIDLGKDVAALKIVNAVKKYKPVAVGLSALLTTTMSEMGNVIKLMREAGLDTPVIIGGPNVNDRFAKKIGAYAAVNNAFAGLRILKKLG
ncbi:MAG: homocysteine S-methyltransferase family protein [candidate division WOR-3 bacterium]